MLKKKDIGKKSLVDTKEIENQLEKFLVEKKEEIEEELEEKIRLVKQEAEKRIDQKKEEIEREKKVLLDYAASIAKLEESGADLKEKIYNHFHQSTKYKTEIENLAELIMKEFLQVRELNKKIGELREEADEKAYFLNKELEERFGITKTIPKSTSLKEEIEVDLEQEEEKLGMIKKLLGPSKFLVSEEEVVGKEMPAQSIKNKESDTEVKKTKGAGKILIMEDDPEVIDIINQSLQKENYSIITSINDEDGFEMAMKEKPDLILLDITMKTIDSFKFLNKLKKDKEISNIPVVILGFLSQEGEIIKGIKEGALDYITKPFSPPVVLEKVKNILS